MAEEKTYVFQPDNSMSMLAPWLANRGVDASTIAAMNNGGWGGNSNMWLIFLVLLMGGGGYGWGNRGGNDFLASQINNDSGREMLRDAIGGNRAAIADLANNLHVSHTAVQGALNQLTLQCQNIGSQVGLSAQQTINAIQAGNAALSSQLATNACSIEQKVNNQGYENRIANMEQTNVLTSKIDAQTQLITDKFAQLELRELHSKLEAERAENTALRNTISNYNQNATINTIVANATAPINATVNTIHNEVEDIKRKQPDTITIPLPVAAQYGITPYGLGGNGIYWG